jgi:hypothetical protein
MFPLSSLSCRKEARVLELVAPAPEQRRGVKENRPEVEESTVAVEFSSLGYKECAEGAKKHTTLVVS